MLDAARPRAPRRRARAARAVSREGLDGRVLPIATPTELLAQLTILSLDPASPITHETLATAPTIAAAGRARDRQRPPLPAAEALRGDDAASLLPRERPAVAGLEVGAVYESAAQVDVGGDVFDFLELADGRLAVVLGDVTGHGIDATADMAMAKFVFRSLAREHSEPRDFLAHANEVVVGRDRRRQVHHDGVSHARPERGASLCASAGHPEPRLVLPDGTVEPGSPAAGLALGIDAPQQLRAGRRELPPGAAVVLYTDGVIEARAGARAVRRRAARRRAVGARTRCRRRSSPRRCSPRAARFAAASSAGRLRDRRRSAVEREPLRAAERPAARDRASRRGGGRAREHARRARSRGRGRAPTSSSSTSRPACCSVTRAASSPATGSRSTMRSTSSRAHDAGVHLDLKLPGYEHEVRRRRSAAHGLDERALVSTAFAALRGASRRSRPRCRARSAIRATALGVSQPALAGALTGRAAARCAAAMPLASRSSLALCRGRTRSRCTTRSALAAAVAAAHRRGAPVLAWTVNDPAAVRRLVALGVDGIVSDDPEMAWRRWLH